jgi:hypothetical protein
MYDITSMTLEEYFHAKLDSNPRRGLIISTPNAYKLLADTCRREWLAAFQGSKAFDLPLRTDVLDSCWQVMGAEEFKRTFRGVKAGAIVGYTFPA